MVSEMVQSILAVSFPPFHESFDLAHLDLVTGIRCGSLDRYRTLVARLSKS